MSNNIYLTDIVREVGGWPINMTAVTNVLLKADEILPSGRDYHRILTCNEVDILLASQ